jgi:salicylate hydroxylase
VSKSGKIILLGDSAHPFLPTSTQGASQAIEDSATIALCLKAAGEGNIPLATRTCEKIRFERVKVAQKSGETQRDKWHNAHAEAEKQGEFDRNQGQDNTFLWDQYHPVHDDN